MKKVLVITGEVSGDLHASTLIRELKAFIPDIKIFGIGGEKLKAEGVEIIYDIKELAVIGFGEVIPKLFKIRRALRYVHKKMAEEKPDLCLLIDYPGFNLRAAKLAKKYNIKVIYYILPQIWAWGKRRIKKIEKYVDKGIAILPFEPEIYETRGDKNLEVKFFGHPLIDALSDYLTYNQETKSTNRIVLLPGSRKGEILRHLPVMLKCVKKLQEENKFECVLPAASGIDKNWIESLCAGYPIQISQGDTYEVLKNSSLAIAASGTVTLEACILGTPMVIIYKTSLFSYILAKLFVKIKWIGLPNIISEKEIVPELIQSKATPENIIPAVKDSLESRTKIVQQLAEVQDLLGIPGSARRAAKYIARMLD